MDEVNVLERLQKVLAHAGVASRRKAEEMILQGKVKVNGKVVTEQGIKVSDNRCSGSRRGKIRKRAKSILFTL